jgi:hypothetical protein
MTAPARITEAADDPSVMPDPVVETEDERRTRLSVYHEIKRLLVAEGIPEHEIAFVHDYEGPAAQAELSRKLNVGEIRIVLASTTKLGVGARTDICHSEPRTLVVRITAFSYRKTSARLSTTCQSTSQV